jgi:hypothetical protein
MNTRTGMAPRSSGTPASGFEGIVSKRLTAPYRSGPSRDWIKVKNPDSPAMVRHREGRWWRGGMGRFRGIVATSPRDFAACGTK